VGVADDFDSASHKGLIQGALVVVARKYHIGLDLGQMLIFVSYRLAPLTMPKLPTHLTNEEMEVQQTIQGELAEWLAELEREGHDFASVVDASFFDQLDPHLELAEHKLRYLAAVKDKVALKGYVNPATGKITIDWRGDEDMLDHEMSSGTQKVISLSEWMNRRVV
jgi:hypothetical protein